MQHPGPGPTRRWGLRAARLSSRPPKRPGAPAPASRARCAGATGPGGREEGAGLGSARRRWRGPARSPRLGAARGSGSAGAGRARGRRRGPRRREARVDSATAPAAGSSLPGSPPLPLDFPPRLPLPFTPPGAAALPGKLWGFESKVSGALSRARPPLRLPPPPFTAPRPGPRRSRTNTDSGGRAPDPDVRPGGESARGREKHPPGWLDRSRERGGRSAPLWPEPRGGWQTGPPRGAARAGTPPPRSQDKGEPRTAPEDQENSEIRDAVYILSKLLALSVE